MAIDFVKKQKSQKKLLIISLIIIVLVVVILFSLMREDESSYVPEDISFPLLGEVKIDFAVLDKIKRFQPFTFIEPLEEEEGRDNPFLPY